jgi:dienelactone hydrolase
VAVRSQTIAFEVAGKACSGHLADGSNGRKVPGILVVHEGRGYTQHPRDRADMLAEMGYVAFAPDYMGGAATSLEQAFEMMSPFAEDRGLFHAYGEASLDVLRGHPGVDRQRLGAIGFCWGGFAVLELACGGQLRAVVGFHPGLSLGPLSDPAGIRGSVLICVGDRDPYVPMSDIDSFIDQMREAQVDCQVNLLIGAPHSFTNPEPYAYETGTDNVGYDALADRRSWAAMAGLFDEAFAA